MLISKQIIDFLQLRLMHVINKAINVPHFTKCYCNKVVKKHRATGKYFT
jgi:hypothetical protein